MPQTRASFCISSLNFTSLLALIRILLFPFLQLLLSLFAGVEFLNFGHEKSGEGINNGLWQFDLVWILTFFLAGHSVLPQQQNLTGSTSVHLTLLPGDTQLPKIVPIHRGETDHFKTWENSHRAPFPPLPFRGFHQKIPHKIARIGREWIELNWVYLSFSFYLPSGFRTSRKRITVLIRLVFQSSGVPQPDFLKSVFETAS